MSAVDPVLFCQLGDQSNDVYFIFDAATNRLSYLSPAFEQIWGVDNQAVISTPQIIWDTIHPEDRQEATDAYQEFKQEPKATRLVFRINYPGDEQKYIRLSLYPVLLAGELKQIAGIAEDITTIQSNIFYMEKINARKNSTLEILAHDLKGPLGVISLIASGLQRETALEGKDHILQSVQFIQDMCQRNIALIRDLVNQEFLESTEVELRKERGDIVAEINDVVHQYKKSEANIAKTFIINSSTEKLYMQLDSLKFMQVINNLISNAIKFTPDNGVIEIEIRDLNEQALIIVRDNGIGIPEDLHPYLFDKFTRARRSGLRGEEPVGLGMSVIKTIIELHRGKIWFTSNENEGSSFYIEIPKI